MTCDFFNEDTEPRSMFNELLLTLAAFENGGC